MYKRIYADNAATTKLSNKAYKSMLPYLVEDYGNASQLYSFSRAPKKAIKEARASIADCLGALPEEIFFTSCGTESDNWAICGAAYQNFNIITSAIEHHAILRPCEFFSSQGLSTMLLPVDDKGIVNISSLKHAKVATNGLLSVMLANNEIASIQPIEEFVSIAHTKGFIFHTDAVQAVGHIKVNVKELGVDMLSASAHKFNGPKGIGFLYIKKGLTWPSFIKGGEQEANHRAGTENVAFIVAMAVALQENVASLDENLMYISDLEKCLLSRLSALGVRYVRNGAEVHIPGNISLSFPGCDAEALLHRLDLQGISVSTGAACNSRKKEVSHVLSAIGMNDELAKGTIRISLGKYNSREEAERIGDVLAQITNL